MSKNQTATAIGTEILLIGVTIVALYAVEIGAKKLWRKGLEMKTSKASLENP